MARAPGTSSTVVHRLPWPKRMAVHASAFFGRCLKASWRSRFVDESGVFGPGATGPVIFCIWHNRLALSMTAYHGYVAKRRKEKGLVAMISASRDGAVLAEVLQQFDVISVRGSSSRRGQQALLEAARWIEKGYHVAITPDGPRGPRYEMKEGAISLAQLTGAPLVPVTANSRQKIVLRSWDQFQIPLPFTRCHIRFHQAVSVNRHTPPEERTRIRQRLETILLIPPPWQSQRPGSARE